MPFDKTYLNPETRDDFKRLFCSTYANVRLCDISAYTLPLRCLRPVTGPPVLGIDLCFIWREQMHNIIYNKTNQMHQFPKFAPAWKFTCFGQFLCPSSGVYSLYIRQDQDGTVVPSWSCSKALFKPVWHIPLLSVQWINSWWKTEEQSETCSCMTK